MNRTYVLLAVSLFWVCSCLQLRASWSEDFESGNAAWVFTGEWGISSEASSSGSFALSDSPNDYYDNNGDSHATLVSPLDLSTAVSPGLSFLHQAVIEQTYDVGRVEVSQDAGASWDPVPLFEVTGQVQAWTRVQIDLTPHAGQNDILIRFRLVTDDSVFQEGWLIDDIHVGEVPDPVVLSSVA